MEYGNIIFFSSFILVVCIVGYIIWKIKMDNLLKFIDSIHFINYQDKDLEETITNYLKHIKPYELGFKTLNNVTNLNNIREYYLNALTYFTCSEKKRLIQYIKLTQKKLKSYSIFDKYRWSLVKVKNVEGNLPFTLDKYIFIPQNYLNSTSNINEWINTLIHEQVHVIQRYHQEQFNQFYYSQHWEQQDAKSVVPHDIYNKLKIVTNPDTMGTEWIYKKNIVPLLTINEKHNLVRQGYDIKEKKIEPLNKLITDYPTNIQHEHPNEIYACLFANRKKDQYSSWFDFMANLINTNHSFNKNKS